MAGRWGGGGACGCRGAGRDAACPPGFVHVVSPAPAAVEYETELSNTLTCALLDRTVRSGLGASALFPGLLITSAPSTVSGPVVGPQSAPGVGSGGQSALGHCGGGGGWLGCGHGRRGACLLGLGRRLLLGQLLLGLLGHTMVLATALGAAVAVEGDDKGTVDSDLGESELVGEGVDLLLVGADLSNKADSGGVDGDGGGEGFETGACGLDSSGASGLGGGMATVSLRVRALQLVNGLELLRKVPPWKYNCWASTAPA